MKTGEAQLDGCGGEGGGGRVKMLLQPEQQQ
jgi:lipopolysaccharide export system protein LptA